MPSPLTCIRCNYNLAGIPADTKCPECAAPVAESIAAQARGGPPNIRRFQTGAAILLPAVILQPFVITELVFTDWIVSSLWNVSRLDLTEDIVLIAVSLLSLAGWWLVTSALPRGAASPRRSWLARCTLPMCALHIAVVVMFSLLWWLVPDSGTNLFWHWVHECTKLILHASAAASLLAGSALLAASVPIPRWIGPHTLGLLMAIYLVSFLMLLIAAMNGHPGFDSLEVITLTGVITMTALAGIMILWSIATIGRPRSASQPNKKPDSPM